MINPADVTVITSCDPPRGGRFEKDYQRAAVRLVRSLRRRGGACAGMPVLCVHDGDVEPRFADELAGMGAEVRRIVAPSATYPATIIPAAAAEPVATPFSLWLDSDIFILRDPSEILDTDADIRAAPTTHAHHRWARPEDDGDWDRLAMASGVDPAVRRDPSGVPFGINANMDGIEGRFYTSCGAVLWRRSTGLGQSWLDIATRAAAAVESGRLPLRCIDAIGEPTLTLAILQAMANGATFHPLPERLHHVYALNLAYHPGNVVAGDVVLTHYQENRVREVSDDEWDVP